MTIVVKPQNSQVAESRQISNMRIASIALCQQFGQNPELVRRIEMRQNYIEFEVYQLDERGGKQVEFGKPVTRLERFTSR